VSDQDNSSVVLSTQHLTRDVDGTKIVDDVSVEVFRGDVLAVFGPSGAGKSSFLRLSRRAFP
jgi:ABC-type transporter Mla maintaining outer membrane lipid asymmetry ATPase subunit MlaF